MFHIRCHFGHKVCIKWLSQIIRFTCKSRLFQLPNDSLPIFFLTCTKFAIFWLMIILFLRNCGWNCFMKSYLIFLLSNGAADPSIHTAESHKHVLRFILTNSWHVQKKITLIKSHCKNNCIAIVCQQQQQKRLIYSMWINSLFSQMKVDSMSWLICEWRTSLVKSKNKKTRRKKQTLLTFHNNNHRPISWRMIRFVPCIHECWLLS